MNEYGYELKKKLTFIKIPFLKKIEGVKMLV